MKRFQVQTALLLVSIILCSCGNDKPGKPHSSGKTAELIVVTNTKEEWSGKTGQAIQDFFNQEYQILPQPEPLFEMANIPLGNFEETAMFQAHHNIFIVDIDDSKGKAAIEVRKNVWAIPQRVILITAPSEEVFVEFFNEKKATLLNVFTACEHERLIDSFNKFKNKEVAGEIKKDFSIEIEIPEGFYIAKKTADFMWVRKETKQFSQGFLFYRYDFTDTVAFEPGRIIAFRNSLTEEYVPGPTESSFMKVSEEYMPVISKRIDFNGFFAVETRGLWEVENDFMGGPFINYTLVDEKRNKVLTVDGYVYAPNAPKRDLLIQMESIIYSLKFGD
jgi:hypothetical protein